MLCSIMVCSANTGTMSVKSCGEAHWTRKLKWTRTIAGGHIRFGRSLVVPRIRYFGYCWSGNRANSRPYLLCGLDLFFYKMNACQHDVF